MLCPSTPTPAQAGFGLVEAIVAAALLLVLGLVLYTSFSAASNTTGRTRDRALAASIATQDQERMRAMPMAVVSNLRETRTQTAGAIAYTVTSRADWVTDSSGTVSCTSTDRSASYLRISTSVTSAALAGRPPVRVESLLAPPNGSFGTNRGSLAIQVVDRDGAGHSGISVSLTGPASFTETANEFGCVLFGHLPVGNYTASFPNPGCIGPTGDPTSSAPVGVVGETTTVHQFECDGPGRIDASFDTERFNLFTLVPLQILSWTQQPAQAERISVAHSGLPAPGTRIFGNGTASDQINATSLYPFSSPYAVYSGDCVGADPATYGQPRTTVQVNPGGTYAATVREPALNLLVTRLGVPVVGGRVRVTAKGSGCSGTRTLTTNSLGRLTEPGMPYGVYDVCVDTTVAGIGLLKATQTNIHNTHPKGTPLVSLSIGLGLGSCA